LDKSSIESDDEEEYDFMIPEIYSCGPVERAFNMERNLKKMDVQVCEH
jgi:hypothetical protein